MTTLILLAVIIALSYAVYYLLSHRTSGVTIGSSVVVKALESCGEMTTLKSYFESVADMNKENDTLLGGMISIPGTWRKFIVIFQGIADCGFDMRRAKAEIFENAKRIEITLPHAKILRVWIDLENNAETGRKNIRVHSQDGGWFSQNLTLEEQNAVVSEALKNIRQKAESEWDILSKAEDNAASFYKNFLGSLGYEISVIFTDDEEKLNVPAGVKADTMKGGGVVIFRAA